MNKRIRVINISALVRVRTANEHKILLVLDGSVQDAPAIFKSLSKKAVCIVSGCGNPNHEFVRVRFHGFFEKVVLLRRFERMYFVANRNIAVQRILCVRIRRKCPNKKRAIREICLHGMLVVVIYDVYVPAVLLILAHALDVVVQEVEGFQ